MKLLTSHVTARQCRIWTVKHLLSVNQTMNVCIVWYTYRHKAKQNTSKSTVLIQDHCLPNMRHMFDMFTASYKWVNCELVLLHTVTVNCDCELVSLHTVTVNCDCELVLLHTVTVNCDCELVLLHTVTVNCDCELVLLHTVTVNCDCQLVSLYTVTVNCLMCIFWQQ